MSNKVKTNKTAVKRFKKTSSGKIIMTHAHSSHLKEKKSKSRLRRQKEPRILTKADEKKIKGLIH